MEVPIPKLEVRISANQLHKGALEVVRAIRPDWPESELNYKIFTDGITNRLIGVYKNGDVHELILIRVYGENTDLFIDRNLELRNMRAMHKAGLSAPIYCTFTNGICYGFTPGKVLDKVSIRKPNIFVLIAENMARMHTLKPKCSGRFNQDSYACLFPGLKKFLALIINAPPLKDTFER